MAWNIKDCALVWILPLHFDKMACYTDMKNRDMQLKAYEKTIFTHMSLRNTNIVQGIKIIDGLQKSNTRKYRKSK